MALDPANFLNDLDATQPPFDDPAGQSDDHLRAIKNAIRNTFAGGDWNAQLDPLVTISILEGLHARLTALEAVSTPTLVGPAFGRVSIASGVTSNQAVTGLGFQPGAVLIIAAQETAANFNVSVGLADGTNDYCLWAAADGGPQLDSNSYAFTQLWDVRHDTGSSTMTSGAQGTLASMDADGFTLNPTFTDFDIELIWMALK